MKHWMFSCRDVSRKISQSMDTSLPLAQRIAVRFHLMMCCYCARFRRQLFLLRDVCTLEDSGPPLEQTPERLSVDTKARIKEKLRNQC